jgi:hypothetical protein
VIRRWRCAGRRPRTPLFFSLGLDEILSAVREVVRDLNVNSTMLGQVVHAVGSTDGRLDSGAHIPATRVPQMTSPSLWLRHRHLLKSTRSRKMHEEHCRSRSVLGHPPIRRASYVAEVSWGAVRLRAEILLVAYLDDIYCSCEVFLFRSYRRVLVAKGRSLVGLEFSNVANNNMYVPRCFPAEIRDMFPDASFVDDDAPGATPKDQLRPGASRRPAGSSGLWG